MITIRIAEIRETAPVDGWRTYEFTGVVTTYTLEWRVGPDSQEG